MTVEEADGEFIATFYDANVSCQGDTKVEAFANLKEMLLTRLEYLEKQPARRLSKPLKRQLTVLREFIGRRA